METKKSINTNQYDEPILNSGDLIQLMLQEKNINHTVVDVDEEIELFLKHQRSLSDKMTIFYDSKIPGDIGYEDFHDMRANEWTFPEEYQKLDILQWLLDRADTQEKKDLVLLEYKMYEERGLIMILRLFLYLMEFLQKHKFVRGVGRGSAVSSYILYLIGVHKVDPIKYNLDINEFLK